jgi:hypothetical protein
MFITRHGSALSAQLQVTVNSHTVPHWQDDGNDTVTTTATGRQQRLGNERNHEENHRMTTTMRE